MTAEQRRSLRALEGRLVHLALADGSRLDDVALVSAGKSTLWVFVNGEDVFVPVEGVLDAWEARPYRSAA
ncbi:MAG TPA: hypothetical protein VHG90_14895 [Acidimicrobiales bacterium]|nr:hypothetical protein [Acidimicrobiales bacterium]